MITIHQLARIAGVSPATVSMALHDHPRIGAATRKRIQELAATFQYQTRHASPHAGAARCGILGCIVPYVGVEFFSRTLAGMIAAAFAEGYQVMPLPGHVDIAQTLQSIQILVARGVDGLVLYPGQLSAPIPAEVLISLKSHGLPAVCVNHSVDPLDLVATNEDQCGRLVIEHLFALGHRCVACIGHSNQHPRQHALASVAREYGMETHLIESCGTDLSEMLATLVQRQPLLTAFIGHDDLFAGQILQFAAQQGLHVPQDISVVGCNNRRLPVTPRLTTVELFPEEIGRNAVILLLQRLKEPCPAEPRELTTIRIEPLLIIGQSSAPARQGALPQMR
ncbi:MAG: LacI family DNA-binding transcriptional regulator [Armatimonadota bacterium]